MMPEHSPKYGAFISYSHARDKPVARHLQHVIQTLGKPWYSRRATKIFRDDTSLSATPELWPTIVEALEQSNFFILLASPEAGQSPWVAKELDWWLSHKSAQKLLIGLTAGELVWNDAAHDFEDTTSPPLPSVANGRFASEPLWLDLKKWRDSDDGFRDDPEFKALASKFAARIRGLDPEDLWSEELRQQRRNLRLAGAAITGLTALFMTASYLGWVFYKEWRLGLTTDSLRLVAASQSAAHRGDARAATLLALEASHDANAPFFSIPYWRPKTHQATLALDTAWRTAGLPGVDESGVPLPILEGHGDAVLNAQFSPDGKLIATASKDNTARLWSADGNLIKVLSGHSGAVHRVAFSANGMRILTASADHTARLWNHTGAPIAILKEHTGSVLSVAFAPDGENIVTSSSDGTARIWTKDGQPVTTLTGHDGPVQSAQFSPDGRFVLTASHDKTARLWDLSGDLIHTFKGHNLGVISAVFSPDGKRILTASAGPSHTHLATARLWGIDGKPIQTMVGQRGWLTAAKFSPDGNTIVTISTHPIAKLWNGHDGSPLATLSGHSGVVMSANFNTEGTRVVTVSVDQTAKVWKLDGSLVATFSGHCKDEVSKQALECAIRDGVFSPDGKKILTASDDRTARIWSGHGRIMATIRTNRNRSDFPPAINAAAFSLKGDRFLTASHDGAVVLWDNSGSELIRFEGHQGVVSDGYFNHDGTRVLTTSADRTARLWNAETGDAIHVFKGLRNVGPVATFSPDGNYVLTVTADNAVRVWDVNNESQSTTLKGHAHDINTAQFCSDNATIVTASGDSVRIWDVSGKLINTIDGTAGGYATCSPDASRVAVYGNDDGQLWTRDGRLHAELKGHTSSIWGIVFARDGKRLLTYSPDNTARIWDQNGTTLAVLSGHMESIEHAEFSPDETLIVTASMDQTARVWDLAGNTLAVLAGHTSHVRRASFHPSGKRILTASMDGRARIWSYYASTQQLIERARSNVGSCFSPTERARYLLRPGTPYWCNSTSKQP